MLQKIVRQLVEEHRLSAEALRTLLMECDATTRNYLRDCAVRTATEQFGLGIYIRGLIEVSSYCRCDCLYCGLRRSNREALRYRLSSEQILESCKVGYDLGFRTFVLQGGEDAAFTDKVLVGLLEQIHSLYADAAITLSLGERSEESYARLRKAGASRYLLRHEAASPTLYASLHPTSTCEGRMRSIRQLKNLGYQTGVGMMVGVPGQGIDELVEDFIFMQQLRPEMVGIGPFLPHHQTPFTGKQSGSLELTLLLLAVVRLLLPDALIPSTTALATLSPEGRKMGILSGANVVMPNLSPSDVRSKYSIYDNKASLGAEAAEGIKLLERELESIGYHIDFSRGDFKGLSNFSCQSRISKIVEQTKV